MRLVMSVTNAFSDVWGKCVDSNVWEKCVVDDENYILKYYFYCGADIFNFHNEVLQHLVRFCNKLWSFDSRVNKIFLLAELEILL